MRLAPEPGAFLCAGSAHRKAAFAAGTIADAGVGAVILWRTFDYLLLTQSGGISGVSRRLFNFLPI